MSASVVYRIVNDVTGRCYVGCTRDTTLRWHNHRSHLRRGIHGNLALQSDWSQYGEGVFRFEVIVPCLDGDNPYAIEERWITHYRDTNEGVYNCQERTWERRHTSQVPIIANGLRALRERRLLSQSDLAAAVGVSRYQTVADWERGTKRPRPTHLRALCTALGVSADELLAALAHEVADDETPAPAP